MDPPGGQLAGAQADVEQQARTAGLRVTEGPPAVPTAGRRSLRPSALRGLTGEFVAEVGVGVVHLAHAVESVAPPPDRVDLHRRIKEAFDPRGRLNPGRRVA